MAKKRDVRKLILKDHEYFAQAVDGLAVDALKQEVLRYAAETEKTTAYLEQLNEPGNPLYAAKAAVSEIVGPINDAKKGIKLKLSYLSLLIEEKGGSLP